MQTVVPQDTEYFKDVADGRLSVQGEEWSYNRHGRGVRFTCRDGRVVDVHIGMSRQPAGITAWRLLQYLDSLGVREVLFEEMRYASEEEADLERLLVRMQGTGVVRAAEGGIYEWIAAHRVAE